MVTITDLQQKSNEDFWMVKLKRSLSVPPFKRNHEANVRYVNETCKMPYGVKSLLEKATAGKPYNKLLFFSTAIFLWLKRYTSNSTLLVATTPPAELSPVDPGSLLFLDLHCQEHATVRDFLKDLHREIMEAAGKSNYSFHSLIERYTAHTVQADLGKLMAVGIAYNKVNTIVKNTFLTDLAVSFCEEEEGDLELSIAHCNLAFTTEETKLAGEQIITILAAICSSIDAPINRIDIVSEAEKQLQLRVNDNFSEYAVALFPEIFARIVAENISRPAVICDTHSLSYEQLDILSDKVATRLVETEKVLPGELVAVMMGHNFWRIVAILGILKAGAGYVPIKSDLPGARIRFMLKDCSCRVLLSENSLSDIINELDIESVLLLSKNIDHWPARKIATESVVKPDQPFVVLYTSGSSGTPKGVILEHRNLYDRLMGEVKLYDLKNDICTIQTSNYAFDSSLLELFLPFILGGKLVIPTEQQLSDYEQLAGLVNRHQVTDIQANPNFLKSFLDVCVSLNIKFSERLQRIWSGGESLNSALVGMLKKNYPSIMISNHYGPTEGTIDAIVNKDLSGFERNIIGRPIFNMQVYILDNYGNRQPLNFPGEICVSGNGLARGYLNLPELTSQKFIDHPYEPGKRLYKTGDLGRMLADGTIEYLGRIDNQIKIRGYRIEPGEVESNILRFTAVKEVVVLSKTDATAMKYLTAYVIFNNDADIAGLRQFLAAEIPNYMVPAYFVPLARFPLNAAGKIDRNALAAMDDNAELNAQRIIQPRNPIEEKLHEIWEKVLGKNGISTDSNFFEIGGQSLKATQIMFQVYRVFKVKIGLKDIFNYPTITELSTFIAREKATEYNAIPFAAQKEYYDASNAQKRIWIISQDPDMSVAYNLPGAYILTGTIDVDAFSSAYRVIIDRHEALRTTFVLKDDGLKQKINEDRDNFYSSLKVTKAAGLHSGQHSQYDEALINEFFNARFDFETGPLIKAHLIELSANSFLFLFSVHHIITDEWSLEIFISEFLALYEAFASGKKEIPYTKKLQYRDVSEYRHSSAASLQKQKEYWLDKFNGVLPRLNMPFDSARTTQFGREEKRRFEFDKTLKKKIELFSKEKDSTIFITLFTFFNVLLSKICDQEDVITGTVSSGRNIPELESIMGLFVNALALRNFPQKEKTFDTFYHEVKENMLEAFANQDFEFEEIIKLLKVEREFNRNPLFNVLFEFQNAMEIVTRTFSIDTLDPAYRPAAKFDLVVSVTNKEDRISFSWTYNSLLFNETTIQKMGEAYRQVAIIAMEHPGRLLKQFDLTSASASIEHVHQQETVLQNTAVSEKQLFTF